MTIEDKIYAAKAATDVYDLAKYEVATYQLETALHFWLTLFNFIRHHLLESALPKIVVSANVVPMSDEEVKAFEKTRCPFQKWKHMLVSAIELSDLIWLNECDDFRQDLRRYIASEKIQREIINDDST